MHVIVYNVVNTVQLDSNLTLARVHFRNRNFHACHSWYMCVSCECMTTDLILVTSTLQEGALYVQIAACE